MKRATEILAALVNDPGLSVEDAMLQSGMESVIETVAAALGMEATDVADAIERHADSEAAILDFEMQQLEAAFGDDLNFDGVDEPDLLDLPLDAFTADAVRNPIDKSRGLCLVEQATT